MTEEQAEHVIELLEEIKELKKIDSLLNNEEYRQSVNVRFCQNYGDCEDDYKRVVVAKRHLHKFIDVLRNVIRGVEEELHEL